MSHPTPAARRHEGPPSALKKSRQPADAATTFGIISVLLGIIAIAQDTLGAAAVAMGVLGLLYAWRGNPGGDRQEDADRAARDRRWRLIALGLSIVGIGLGSVGVVQVIWS